MLIRLRIACYVLGCGGFFALIELESSMQSSLYDCRLTHVSQHLERTAKDSRDRVGTLQVPS